jgi:predicted nucleic-acid-binding protein
LKSVDTNVLVRFILGDDPSQSAHAEAIVKEGVFVSITVLLELGWVLGSRYGLARKQLSETLEALLDVPGITVADEPAIRDAIVSHATGADFADALHLAASQGTEAFVTFDKGVKAKFAKGLRVEVAG